MNDKAEHQNKNKVKSFIEQSADDYARDMFADGHNRTQNNPLVANAPDYDAAAHSVDEYTNTIYLTGHGESSEDEDSSNAGYSPAGTGASGRDDKDGGHLGGTEEDLDALEISHTPVDKHSNIKQ